MLWLLVLIAGVLAILYYRWSRRRLYQLAREIPPGMKVYPLIGQAYIFYGSNEDQMKGIQKLGDTANKQGGFLSFWLGHKLYIGTTDPPSIELVTKTCLEKDDFLYKFMRTVTRNGSIFAPVKIWHPRRKIIAPFFSLKNLNYAVTMFQEQSQIMADLMGRQVGAGDFSIFKYMTAYTLDTIIYSAAEIKTNFQADQDNMALRTLHELTKIVASRMLQPWLHPDFIYERLPVHKRFLYLRQWAYNFIDGLIQEKRKGAVKTKEDTVNGFTSMFDVAVTTSGGADKGYTDLELREEAIVLCVAGNDTSAVSSSFTAVMLSRHQDVQEKVYQELREVFGESDRAITAEDLPKLKYLETVIKETLRLYPPVPMIFREVHDDITLPSGQRLVEGSSVMINIWGTHRNPAYWGADAELFRPERFLEGQLTHPAMFIPFSYSLRQCLGTTYAMLIIKTGLANILRRYKLLPPANMAVEDLKKPPRVRFELMMKDVDNYMIRVEERHKINNSKDFYINKAEGLDKISAY